MLFTVYLLYIHILKMYRYSCYYGKYYDINIAINITITFFFICVIHLSVCFFTYYCIYTLP